jgi:hypothetical protein
MKGRSPDGEDAVVTIRFVKICKMKGRSPDGETPSLQSDSSRFAR